MKDALVDCATSINIKLVANGVVNVLYKWFQHVSTCCSYSDYSAIFSHLPIRNGDFPSFFDVFCMFPSLRAVALALFRPRSAVKVWRRSAGRGKWRICLDLAVDIGKLGI
jgi:hypothetical protein